MIVANFTGTNLLGILTVRRSQARHISGNCFRQDLGRPIIGH